MRYVSYFRDGTPHAGLVDGDDVVPLLGVGALGRDTPKEVLARPDLDESGRVPLADVTLRPVVPEPQKIFCVGLNYRSHVTETKRELPTYPVLFTKFPTSLIGPDDPILVPAESEQVDYEAELAVVIGRTARRVTPADAFDVIAGYTIANDVTMRDYQYRTHQWLQGKAWDASTPLGPWLVTEDEIGERVGKLAVSLTLNGEVLQSSDTSRLIFDIPTLVSTVSEFTTLLPGDVILTGTPGGVGFRRDPQVFLTPGDRVAVVIDGLGELTSTVRSETAADAG
ncbi:fumarylacetoacetate hydrolase family protein [Streptomyces sp. NPDC058464]|uniref:fumarylacetoacetate hydrolase family protein n=1 Tax=Streptomyces sp. NPDC058464 TaxID=3346511 RepID=UPI0036576965